MSPFNRLWLRRTATLFLPGLILVAVLCFWFFQNEAGGAIARGVAPVRTWIGLAEIQLAEAMQVAGRDTLAVAASPALKRLAEPDRELQADLAGLLSTRLELSELRVLDVRGNIRLRFERRGDEIIRHAGIMPDDESRQSVRKLADMPAGVVRIAPFSLDMEGGRPHLPYRPGILFSTVVSGAAGEPVGMVQVRLDGWALYRRLMFGHAQDAPVLWMLEENGQWLFGGAEKDNWRWLQSPQEGQSLKEKNAGLWSEMRNHIEGVADLASGLFVYREIDPVNTVTAQDAVRVPVSLVPERQPYLWYLAAPIRENIKQQWLDVARGKALTMFLLGLVAVLAFAVLLGWRLARLARKGMRGDDRNVMMQILDKAPIGALLNDFDGRRVYVNPFWQTLTGMSAERAVGQGWRAAIHPDDLDYVLACWDRVISKGEAVELEYRLLHVSGKVNWARGALLPLRSETDEIIAYIGVMADITSLKEREDIILAGQHQIERAHQELDSIFNSSSDPIVALDPDYRFTIFNTAYANLLRRLYGINIERGDSLSEKLMPFPEDRLRQMNLWSRAIQGEGLGVRQAFGDPDRERRTFDLSFSPQHGSEVGGAVMVMRDISVTVRVEEALIRSEELFRSATESSLDAVIVLEAARNENSVLVDFKVVECNQIALDLFHRRRADCMGELLGKILPGYFAEGLFDRFRQVFDSGQPCDAEHQHVDVSGEVIWQQYQVVAISNGLTVTVRDITERKAFERRLFESEARISAILANVQEGIVTLDESGVIRSANPACCRLFAYEQADMTGQPFSLLFPQIAHALPAGDIVAVLEDELRIREDVSSVVDGVGRDGAMIPVEISCKAVRVGEERFYAVTLHGVAERRAYESRLQQNIAELELLRENLNETNEQLFNANRELSRLAHLDGLTGLPNRRHFDHIIHSEWVRCAREHSPLALIMVDVDHFKRYNDSYGHQAGDECLKLVAEAIRRALHRPADFAARYGGEEFVVILPNTELDGAEQVARAIMEDVQALAIVHANSPVAAWVTISAGIACVIPQSAMSEASLLASADQALYRAKQHGRNRLELAGRE